MVSPQLQTSCTRPPSACDTPRSLSEPLTWRPLSAWYGLNVVNFERSTAWASRSRTFSGWNLKQISTHHYDQEGTELSLTLLHNLLSLSLGLYNPSVYPRHSHWRSTHIEEGLNARGVLSRLFTPELAADNTIDGGHIFKLTIFALEPSQILMGEGDKGMVQIDKSRSFELDQPRMTPQGGGVNTASCHRHVDNPIFIAHFRRFEAASPLRSRFESLSFGHWPHIVVMSRASKLTLAATGLGTAGIVYFVHWAQENDRAVCLSSNCVSNLLVC